MGIWEGGRGWRYVIASVGASILLALFRDLEQVPAVALGAEGTGNPQRGE